MPLQRMEAQQSNCKRVGPLVLRSRWSPHHCAIHKICTCSFAYVCDDVHIGEAGLRSRQPCTPCVLSAAGPFQIRDRSNGANIFCDGNNVFFDKDNNSD